MSFTRGRDYICCDRNFRVSGALDLIALLRPPKLKP